MNRVDYTNTELILSELETWYCTPRLMSSSCNFLIFILILLVIQSLTRVQLFPTPGSSVLHCLPEFAQIHVHWIGDAI